MSVRLVLTRYSIYRFLLIACTCIMLGFFQLFPSEIVGGYASRFIVAVIGVLLAISTIDINNHKFRQYSKKLNLLVGIYSICVVFAMINTQTMYHYSTYELTVALMPFLYVYFAYPLLYLFCKDGDIEKTIATITKCVLIFLIIKGVSWAIYTLSGSVLFSQILFEYGQYWVRNGIQRVNAGYLVGIALAFCIQKGFAGDKKFIYKIFTFYIIAFLWFVTAYRFQFIVSVIVLLTCLYFSDSGRRTRENNRIIIVLFVVIALFSPFVSDLIDSFSVSNADLGSSTVLRLLTIQHFYSIMVEKNPILGLGLMISENPIAESLLRKSQWRLYYLEDIGIVGGWFKLGILSIGIYGLLFYWGIRDLLSPLKTSNVSKMFMIGIVTYMIFSCIMLNIFDLQRAFDVPFYVALVVFYHCDLHNPIRQ